MRLDLIFSICRKELRETLRDRRSLAMMFGIPLLLYPLATLAIYSLNATHQRKLDQDVYSVAVIHADSAPRLLAQLKEEDSKLRLVSPDDPSAALRQGQIDAIIELPPDAEKQALAAEKVELKLRLDRSRPEAAAVEKKLTTLVEKYEKWIVNRRLEARGVPKSVLNPISSDIIDIASGQQRLGKILAMALPNILLLTGMLGAFFPALNATTTERESGTLEALLVTPAQKSELLVGKGVVVLLSSLLTAALNLLSMSLVLWRVLSSSDGIEGTLAISFGALGLTYLAVLPGLILFSTLVMVVGLFARSFREANSYATPVMMIPLLSLIVSIGQPETTRGLLVTPVLNTAVVIRDVLTGHATAQAFLLAFVSNCVYAGLMLSLATRMFTSEQLVNPTWEALSFPGLRRSNSPRRIPAIDEAIVLFALVLLLMFYVSPSLVKYGFLPVLAGNELLLITAPTLLLAFLGRYDWSKTFSFRSVRWLDYAGGLLIGVGMALAMELALFFYNRAWAPDPAKTQQMNDLLLPALRNHPLLLPLIVGLLAGVCEEFLFRGPIQAAFARRLKIGPTLLISGLLFAGLHMDLHGLPIRLLISLLLGWMVWRGGSIFPAMLTHAAYDAASLFAAAWKIQGKTLEQINSMEPQGITALLLVRFGLGLILLLGGLLLCRSLYRRRLDQSAGQQYREPAPLQEVQLERNAP